MSEEKKLLATIEIELWALEKSDGDFDRVLRLELERTEQDIHAERRKYLAESCSSA